MKYKITTLMLLSTMFTANVQAGEPVTSVKVCNAYRIANSVPIIDGKLNDSIWNDGDWCENFMQYEPYNGKEPTQKTAFKIAYDKSYLYAAFRMFDSEPDKIVARVSRRDNLDGDLIMLAIDSYFDKRTAFVFEVNAAGVKGDVVVTEDGDGEDSNWDPIWWAKASRDSIGWSAEMKIPLNQLRFVNASDIVWGIQVSRQIYRNQEQDMWKHMPKDAPGVVCMFGELHGLNGLTPKKQVEIAPYVVTKTERFRKEVGNPFVTGKSSDFNMGLDAKIGLTNNFTLDLTVNPDFGQVEADPSEVNLTAFETYFEEKRPFFIEGNNLLSFPLMMGDGDLALNNLFYSRRIGKAPSLEPDLSDNEYSKQPTNTTILGAAKVTGRTDGGFSLGVIESVTSNTYAKIDSLGTKYHELIEPLTNYTILSAKKEYNDGSTIFSSMVTSTNRELPYYLAGDFHKNAFSGGVDALHFWANKKYMINGRIYASRVEGTKEAILQTQESPARYFQRPDNNYVKLDSNRTSLSGSGGLIQGGKVSDGHVRFLGVLAWRSPQLEINDVGYMQTADDIFQVFWMGIRFWEPFSIFRYVNFNINQWTGWDFGGQSTYKGGNVNFNLQFKNYWTLSAGINRDGQSLSSWELRGGPMLKIPGYWSSWYNLGSNSRKSLIAYVGGSSQISDYSYIRYQYVYTSLAYKPSKNIKITLDPAFSYQTKKLSYVDNVDYGDVTRYIRGELSRRTFLLSFRIDYSVNPELSIQYYCRPYFTTGKYTNFKYITNSKANDYYQRYSQYSDNQVTYNADDEVYNVDENNDGTTDFSFDTPNFNFRDLQSNMVVRWEFRPGSTVFFVWTLGKQGFDPEHSNSLTNDINDLYFTHPHNIFLVKFSYRFS